MGLAITDCAFMVSVDGMNWDTFEQPLFGSGIEDGSNWVYGDGYATYGLLDSGNYYSMFIPEGQNAEAVEWYRYEIRKDGFAFYEAGCEKKKVVLKKSVLNTDKIFVNFATAVRGNIFIKVKDFDGNQVSTCEMFGNSINPEASFEEGALEKFVGKEVEIEIEMYNAKLYAVIF